MAEIEKSGPWRTRPHKSAAWSGAPFALPQTLAPVYRNRNGAPSVEMLSWGWRTGGDRVDLQRDGSVGSQGNRCLVPFSYIDLWTDGRCIRVRPLGREWALAGGIAQPISKHGPEVDAFALLSTCAGPDLAPYSPTEIVIIQPPFWSDWLNPARDTRQQQRSAKAGTLTLSEVRDLEPEERILPLSAMAVNEGWFAHTA